jgi:predicted SprT family Zn-dependent metalloprotease
MTAARILETPPDESRVTAYDLAHKILYLRLLDAAAAGADWREVARIVLGLDPDIDPVQARRIHDSHLARARWMTEAGYRDLLRQGSTN